MVDRVAVFLDYQNVYKRARAAFCDAHAPAYEGQIHPLRLAKRVVDRAEGARELVAVQVYRGLPGASQDPKGYGAARAQISKWERSDRSIVTVKTRPLRYPYGWPESSAVGEKPGEKGIDVQLAIDFVAMAVRGEYDIGILFSADTDLKPALEFVGSEDIAAVPEVMAWSPDRESGLHSQRLSVRRNFPYCHYLNREFFEEVRDDQDFTAPKPPLPGIGPR